jgi:hypothetical protein
LDEHFRSHLKAGSLCDLWKAFSVRESGDWGVELDKSNEMVSNSTSVLWSVSASRDLHQERFVGVYALMDKRLSNCRR